MQTPSQPIARDDVFNEEPEREDVDMEVELGVNLVDAFTKKHVYSTSSQVPALHLLAWTNGEVDSGELLPAKCCQDGERLSSLGLDLDEVAQEVLSIALLEEQDVCHMEVDGSVPPFPDWGDPETGSKLEMVVYLYAFEKFRIVYA
ncbi:uncharacterized protein IUM83_10810 [Phytophthora cinnamomi]|uniref:uncharacterized protein n=1 Tax=Phytophthora cinnamomi TaxID=4785 RepID=UPI002A302565|nr:hypothetical protein IUM83_10810 [Phytophthora cinnamomi]KAJ8571553.1 hypothetical protein ON010_g5282 [Phytophthora cinnamomi]